MALSVTLLSTLGVDSSRGSESEAASLARDSATFALNLYKELSTKPGNIFFSPYSVSTALGIAYAASSGATASEMAAALAFTSPPEQFPSAFKHLGEAVRASSQRGGNNLNIATGLCSTGGVLSDGYKAILRESFDAKIFAGGLDEINGWVEEKTGGKIKNILEALSPNSAAVLLSAIYFKGSWATKFQRESTAPSPFHLSSGEVVTVPLMSQTGEFKLMEQDGFQALSLPYSGNMLSMVIILPKAADGLTSLEKKMTPKSLNDWLGELARLRAREVQVFVPRFSLGASYDLIPPLNALGIKDAFNPSADFAGMGYPKGSMWISQVKHKAFAEVNEEGTEAAAATAVEMQTLGVSRGAVFRATHPFLFVIRDDVSGTVLFIGRVADPSDKDS